jgi:catechol 2,3-dioxygenase-like lactoylglutathione lyase family enzyme
MTRSIRLFGMATAVRALERKRSIVIALLAALAAAVVALPDTASAQMLCQHKKSKRIAVFEECTGRYKPVLDLSVVGTRPVETVSATFDFDFGQRSYSFPDDTWLRGGFFYADEHGLQAVLEIDEGTFAEPARCVASGVDYGNESRVASISAIATGPTKIELQITPASVTSRVIATLICVRAPDGNGGASPATTPTPDALR